MSEDWQEMINTMVVGDNRVLMRKIPDDVIQMVATSPPYWGGQRDYGIEPTAWGGDSTCNHIWQESTSPPTKAATQGITDVAKRPYLTGNGVPSAGHFCQECNAWLGCLGMEPTPQLFVAHIVEVFREVYRILRPDGVAFLNIADTYCGSWGSHKAHHRGDNEFHKGIAVYDDGWCPQSSPGGYGLKPQDMALVPERLKIALQDDGWYVRSTLIWEKPNCLTESVKNRPTNSHEYIIMLTKRASNTYWLHPELPGSRTKPEPDYLWVNRQTGEQFSEEPIFDLEDFYRKNLWESRGYYWDYYGIKEPYTEPHNRWGGDSLKKETVRRSKYMEMNKIGASSAMRVGRKMRPDAAGRNRRTVFRVPTKGAAFQVCRQCETVYTGPEFQALTRVPHKRYDKIPDLKTLRKLNAKLENGELEMVPFCLGCLNADKSARENDFQSHYAAYSEALIEPLIIAASSDQGCPSCGAPWERLVETEFASHDAVSHSGYGEGTAANRLALLRQAAREQGEEYVDRSYTVGWRPSCSCANNDGSAPSIVLDPFAGTGTTSVVAKRFRRRHIGLEAGYLYTLIGERRLRDTCVESKDEQLMLLEE